MTCGLMWIRYSEKISGTDNPALKMAFMTCFNTDKLKTFLFESTFLSKFDVPQERIEQIRALDVETMKFGFDWMKFFLP